VFCEVIPFVVFSWFSVDVELPLLHSITDPAQAHVYDFRLFLFNGVINDSLLHRHCWFGWGWQVVGNLKTQGIV